MGDTVACLRFYAFINRIRTPLTTTLHIVDQVVLTTTAGSGESASLTYLDNWFHQTSIPEPATYFTLGSGLIGLALIRFRRK